MLLTPHLRVKERADARRRAKEKVKARMCLRVTIVENWVISRQIAGHPPQIRRLQRTETKVKARARESVRPRHLPTKSLAGIG